ncbi:scavenger receptor cysteine-rich domain-containing protein DMBT1-like [Glandiceps talaboti]
MAIESTSCVQPFHQLRGGLQVYGWMFFFSAFYVVFAGVSSEGPTLPPDYEFVYPLPCDFESSLCQWVQMTADNFDWIRQNGSTPTSGTGPTGDHTNGDGSGHYIYIETSYPRKEDEDARLISNYINPSESDDCTLSFYYHMYGNALGSLNIYSKEVSSTVEDLRWSINGSQGNSWIDGTVSFLSMQHPFQIIIEGVVGNGVRGDIALDDTSFSDGCFKGEDGKVRLVNDGSSSSPNEGRVEVYYNNTWGTICEYDGVWNQSTEGKVICQQLGYQSAEDATSFYPPSHSVPVHLDNVDCTGTELLLTECSNDGWGVARSQCLAPGMRFTDVAVKCTDMAPPPCHLDQFICSNEMCVSNGKLCDYTDNCGDASDEHISLCDSYPGRCDFQDDLCNWIQPSNDDFDWTRQKGSTPTPNTGPDGDHNGMSDKYYMLMEATGRTQYDKAKLALPQTFLPTTDDLCKIRFYYHMTGNDVGVLRLKMLSTTSHAISTVWLESSPQGNDWKFTLITLSNAESFQLYFEGEIGRSDAGDISVDDISFSLGCELANGTCDYDDEPTFNCTNTGECILADHTCDYHHNCLDGSDESPDVCNSRPGICDFQNHFCSWDQSCFDDFDWKRNKWDTDTTSTGPSKDHTLKNILGYYAYIEASNQNPGEVADLVSTSWSASVDRPCYLRFYYHMYGTGIGSLKVIVKDVMSSASVEKWSESGNQGNEWQFASVDLQNSYAEFEVILRAMRGYDNEGKGDIAIDDVSFSEGCEVQTDLLPSDEAEGVRLVDGDDSSEGRIEVFKNSQWGTVCDTTNGFDSRDAGVVCKQLGFKGQLEVKRGGHFGKGSGQIWMTNVGCTGNENSLLECSHSTGTTSCSHDNDVGVICDKTETSGQAVRLTGGRTDVPFEGRVEIFHGGQWGTVCNTTFGLNEAIVVCKQLGYDGAYRPQSFGAGSGSIHLSYLDCCGSELSLSLCRHSSWNTTSTCDHSQDAGVICRSDDHPPEGITYLKHGTESYEGRLEIYHDSQWGTICSNEWSINDAYVACRELNFRSALVYLTNEFGQGSGKTHLNKVGCQGDERHLIDCDHGAWGDYQCSTGHDVGIECTDTITHSLTLVEEDTVGNKGCVQLMSESHPQKKQVCLNGLSDETKTVICHQLGFDGYETIDTSSTCSTGNPRVMIAFPSCSGTEARLSDCTDYAWIPASGSQCGSSTSDPKIVCKVRTTTTIPPQTTHTVVTAPDTHTVPSGSVFTIEGGCDSGAVTHSYGDRKAYIWSPNYPQSYDNNLDCAWTVTLNLKDTIAIQFEALHTEDHDELELYDGDSDDATELGSYSGVQFLETVRTTGRHLYVTFESDNNQICTGFKLLLSVNSDPLPKLLFGPVTQKCCEQTSDEIFDDTYDGNFEKGSIKSPGHPKRYLSHLSCGWMVKLNDSQKVTMTISELDIKDDKLAMFDGKGVSADVLGEYTGEMRRRKRSSDVEPIQSTRNVVVMKFTTNGINQGNGFIVEYEGQEALKPIPGVWA